MESVYYVDENDCPTGETAEKYAAHHAKTKLHAAFSCYVFNEKGEFLVTKRADSKKVWPGVWTNSVCGHPAPGESRENALVRRLDYELGMKVKDIKLVVPKYIYKTPPYNGIVEHEFCPIYVATASSEPIPNPDEVGEFEWVDWSWYVEQTDQDGDDYSSPDEPGSPKWSWWCKDQLRHLQKSDIFSNYTK